MQSPRDRYPSVLAAVVSGPPVPEPPLFDIFPLWQFLSKDQTVAFDIGPRRSWYQSAREYRLLTDEALRWLRSHYSKDDLADALLQAVPAYDGNFTATSASRHIWASGRHPSEPWCWHIPDIMAAIATTPAPTAPPAATATPAGKGRGKHIDARMLKILTERPESLEWTCRQWAEHLGCSLSTVAATQTWKKHIFNARALVRADHFSRTRQRHR